jgi:hypothetical protein
MTGRDRKVELCSGGLMPRYENDACFFDIFGEFSAERVRGCNGEYQLNSWIAVENIDDIENSRQCRDVVGNQKYRV